MKMLMVIYTTVNYFFVHELYKTIGEVFIFANNININIIDYYSWFYFVGTNFNYDGKKKM